MEIRLMNDSDDRKAISKIYEESWKFAYQGLIPQDYLDGIPTGNWAKAVDTPGWNTLLMLDGDQIVGTASYCHSRDDFSIIIPASKTGKIMEKSSPSISCRRTWAKAMAEHFCRRRWTSWQRWGAQISCSGSLRRMSGQRNSMRKMAFLPVVLTWMTISGENR